ncbi:family 16 glycosylhydrolase [candidate division KSB1 bacterium]|nr:family 16 glycosylhydrolase [candidate division KSB1 bacterium]
MKKISYLILFLFLLNSWIGVAKDYKGAEYRTKEAYTYGRFEARYKPPQGYGFLASFFTYHEIENSKEWNEIDFEILGRNDQDVQVTSIGPGQKIRNSHQWVPFSTYDDFHVYAFEWTPEYIAWFVDDQEIYRQTQAHIAQFSYDQKIMMNIWPPEYSTWVGILDDRVLPVFAYYDWIKYSAYTPGSGNTGTNHNFTIQWQDDLNAWDQNRWEKGTHTWGGNNSDFMPENVVFKDGQMILCLTKASPLGYIDQSPPVVLWTRAMPQQIQLFFSENLEPTSAVNQTNYIINGVTIADLKLLSDQRTVALTVSELTPEKTYNLVVMGVKDNFLTHNRMTGQVLQIKVSPPLTFPVKINVGGKAYGDYLADQIWTPALEYGHIDGYQTDWPNTRDILGSDDDTIYQSELREIVKYKIRVPNGSYRVTVQIAENKYTEVGQRIFDIIVEDQKIVTHLDLCQAVGPLTAYQVTAENITVQDELLDLHFANRWDFSLLNGLVVEQLSTQGTSGHSQVPPRQFQVFQNYPNPFNAATTIAYHLPQNGELSVTVYNLLGQPVNELMRRQETAGAHEFTWNADLPSGIYFYHFDFQTKKNHFSEIRKLILLK